RLVVFDGARGRPGFRRGQYCAESERTIGSLAGHRAAGCAGRAGRGTTARLADPEHAPWPGGAAHASTRVLAELAAGPIGEPPGPQLDRRVDCVHLRAAGRPLLPVRETAAPLRAGGRGLVPGQ